MSSNLLLIRTILALFFLGLFVTHFTGDEHYEYILSTTEPTIQNTFGYFYFIMLIVSLLPLKIIKRIPLFIWIICSLALLMNTIGAYIHANFVIEQILEHAIKIGLPIWFYLIIHQKKDIVTITKLLIALTFIGHGIFAIGCHYVPGNFTIMTVTILNISPQSAKTFLLIVGWIDIITALFLFFSPLKKAALIYMIFWGFTTALARAAYGFETVENLDSILYFIGNTFYRLPHGLIPLVLFLNYNVKNKQVKIA